LNVVLTDMAEFDATGAEAPLGAAEDVADAPMTGPLRRCIVTRDWAVWRQDVAWLSLYFTVAVWASIALAHAPPLRGRGRHGPRVVESLAAD